MKNKAVATFVFLALLAAGVSASAKDHVVAQGTFEGRSDHVVKGTVKILKSDDGHVLILGEDFSLDNAPDPKLAMGNNGYKKETLFSKLRKNKGRQEYKLPADLDPTKYNEVWVWCEKFDVPLGVAKLK